ncbi:MAG: ANTAR domain-containing protein [Synergistaceae bacterium]|jgi:response regulator NasT|nr:ANTAR domain-containing protein [Synergistaceae bacterium]
MNAKRIVIADDEPITRLDLSSMLESLGFSVIGQAADGFDAVELCRAKNPDLVLMDIRMPVFDGFWATETILNEEIADCVVMLTAFCDAEFVERAGRIGVTGYLVKPINKRLLAPTIETAYFQSQRLKKVKMEAEEMRQKLEENHLIERAKALMAKDRGISEGDAYRELQRMSMNKRCPMSALAKMVVQSYSERETINRAKRFIMSSKKLSEEKAFRQMKAHCAARGISMQEAARRILSGEGKV